MKKILYFITKGNYGGAQKYVFELAAHLPKYTFEPVVVCGLGGILKKKLEEKEIRSVEMPYLGRDLSFFDDLRSFFSFLRILKKEKPDVLHLNSSKAGVIGVVSGRLRGIRKIIFTAHGFAFNEDRSSLSKILLKFLSWLTILLSDEVICVSEAILEQVATWPFIRKGKIHRIYNGISEIEFLKEKDAREKVAALIGHSTDLFKGNKLLVSIAELTRNKNLELAIEAVAPLKNVIYIVIGAGEEKEKLEKLVAEKDLRNQVFLIGNLPNAGSFLKAFDIFLLSSKTEAFPYCLLEAGAGEVPVVATAVGGVPEIIDSSSGILVRPNQAREFGLGIKFLLEHKNERGLFAENLKKKVLEQFQFKKMLDETLALY